MAAEQGRRLTRREEARTMAMEADTARGDATGGNEARQKTPRRGSAVVEAGRTQRLTGGESRCSEAHAPVEA